MRLCDLLAARGYRRAYIMADCREALLLGTGALTQAFVRADMIELAGGDPDALTERLRATIEVIVVSGVPHRIQTWAGKSGVGEIVCAQVRHSGNFRRLSAARDDRVDVLLLASANDVVADELAKLCERLGARALRLDLTDPTVARAIVCHREGSDPLAGLAQAKLAIDLSPFPTSLSVVLAEMVTRQQTPFIVFVRGPAALGLWRFPNRLRPGSISQLLRTVAEALADDAAMASLRECATHREEAGASDDEGWARVRLLLATPSSDDASKSDAVAKLFGHGRR